MTDPERRAPSPTEPSASRRRGRPRRDEGPAVTTDAIVGIALDDLRANGWSGLALRDVARRLGVSLPAVQRHFPTKDDLWRACVDRMVAELLVRTDPPPAGPPSARLLAGLRAQVERSGLEPGVTAAMLHDRSPGADDRLEYLLEALRPVVENGRTRLRRAIEAGAMRPVDEDVVLAVLGIGLSSLAHSGRALQLLFGIDLEDADQRDHFATTLVDILISGLRRPE